MNIISSNKKRLSDTCHFVSKPDFRYEGGKIKGISTYLVFFQLKMGEKDFFRKLTGEKY